MHNVGSYRGSHLQLCVLGRIWNLRAVPSHLLAARQTDKSSFLAKVLLRICTSHSQWTWSGLWLPCWNTPCESSQRLEKSLSGSFFPSVEVSYQVTERVGRWKGRVSRPGSSGEPPAVPSWWHWQHPRRQHHSTASPAAPAPSVGSVGSAALWQRPWHRAGSEGCVFVTTSCHQSQLCHFPSPLWAWTCPGTRLQGCGFLWGSWVCCFACCTFIPSLLSVCRFLRGCFLSSWIFWVERTLKDSYKMQLFCS